MTDLRSLAATSEESDATSIRSDNSSPAQDDFFHDNYCHFIPVTAINMEDIAPMNLLTSSTPDYDSPDIDSPDFFYHQFASVDVNNDEFDRLLEMIINNE